MDGSSRRGARGSTPRWMRAVLAVDRAAERVAAAQRIVRDELVWAWTAPEERDAVTLATYEREAQYVEGAPFFERGFFAWEERELTRLALPRGARVLVGGGGGGREMRALSRAGYAVTAFEPCARLAEAACVLARGLDGARVLRGGYGDLPDAARGAGPLASLRDDAGYALVLLGWRSLSHVLEADARGAIFRALREIAPGAPIVASFLPRTWGANAGPKRRALRRALAALGAPGERLPGGEFFPRAGFAVALAREDLERDAGDAYTVARYEDGAGEGVAVLEPPPAR